MRSWFFCPGRPQQEHGARHFLQEIGEILATHGGLHLLDSLLAENPLGHIPAQLRDIPVIDQDWVEFVELELGF